MSSEIKLTQYSRGAGCGCKIAPAVLEEILKTDMVQADDKRLLVGNSSNDDAAAYDMGNGMAMIATTDFFMPIVDDAYDFGRIAAANAISDVYAMGGKPMMAIAILGWPVDTLPVPVARKVLEGARAVCAEAGIPLAGGHSIDTTEPIFGLAVNGICAITELKQNNTARQGDWLFLTKALGTGILATAQKRGMLREEHEGALIAQMTTLNRAGEALAKIAGVTAMTDVTGFGLAGHLIEMAEGSGLSAEVYYSKLALLNGTKEYLAQRIVPDATYRNWNGYNAKISFGTGVDVMEAFSLLPDPQTNGGLLIAVTDEAKGQVVALLQELGLSTHTEPIGRMVAKEDKVVLVQA
jgi:selenide,water dikinase